MHSTKCDSIFFLHLSLNLLLMLFPQYQRNKTTPNNKESDNKKYLWRLTIRLKSRQSQQPALLFFFFFSYWIFISLYSSNILFQIHIVLRSACSDDKLARMWGVNTRSTSVFTAIGHYLQRLADVTDTKQLSADLIVLRRSKRGGRERASWSEPLHSRWKKKRVFKPSSGECKTRGGE